MSSKIKLELEKIEIPKELHERAKLGVKKAKLEQPKNRFKNPLVAIAMISFLFLGSIFAISPEVRSMTEKWTNQVFKVDIFSEEKIEINDGYVFVDGVKTISEEKYKLGFYEPVYTEDGYILKKTDHKDHIIQKITEENLGKKFQNTTQASAKADFMIKKPAFLPKDISLDSVYVKDQRVHIAFKTDAKKDLFIIVQKKRTMEGHVVLDDVETVYIGENGKIGKTPHKFWDSKNNKPAVKSEYVLTFVDNGIQYELFGTNITQNEIIKIAQSMR